MNFRVWVGNRVGESEDKIKYGLNNCPFCGSVVIKMQKVHYDSKFTEAHKEMFEKAKIFHEKYGKPHRVHCDNCGADGPPCSGPEGAARAWNKSTPNRNPFNEGFQKINKKTF